MRMTRGTIPLQDRDYDLLLTNDPKRFITGITSSIFWDVQADRKLDIAKYQQLFEQWLDIYMQAITEPVDQWLDKQVIDAENFGRLDALSTLPIKTVGSLRKREVVDLAAVAVLISELHNHET